MLLTILLKKILQIPPRKVKQEPWIMFGPLKNIRKQYKKLLLDSVTEEYIKSYKEQCSILRKLKRRGKQMYYAN